MWTSYKTLQSLGWGRKSVMWILDSFLLKLFTDLSPHSEVSSLCREVVCNGERNVSPKLPAGSDLPPVWLWGNRSWGFQLPQCKTWIITTLEGCLRSRNNILKVPTIYLTSKYCGYFLDLLLLLNSFLQNHFPSVYNSLFANVPDSQSTW
jgi:hypothetical protein